MYHRQYVFHGWNVRRIITGRHDVHDDVTGFKLSVRDRVKLI
jgi:hypothetical protein